MKRRWFTRIFFMLPILLCLAGWLWSSTHLTGVYGQYADRGVYLGTASGTLRFEWVAGETTPGWKGWVSINEPLDPTAFWPSKEADDATLFDPEGSTWLLGFSYRDRDSTLAVPGLHFRGFGVPYWFPLVVSGGVFAWVWRKTRKPKPGRAFPVEASKPTAEQSSKAI